MRLENEEKQKHIIRRYEGTLSFTEEQLRTRVNEYINKAPGELYFSDIVDNDKINTKRTNGYKTDTGKMYCEVIADEIIKQKSQWVVPTDEKCTYNPGKRKEKLSNVPTDINEMRYYYTKQNSISETKLMHCLCKLREIDNYRMVDYQVPTTNGRSDKIDIILSTNDMLYITEAKSFGSKESLLRCVLEISTYYQKLNDRFFKTYGYSKDKVKKAVLIDRSSWAYRQCEEDFAKRLLNEFEITVFELSQDTLFHIKEYPDYRTEN